MKIIKEIEKGRLDEESMIRITGGEGNDPCTPYVNCTGQYIVKPCANHAMKLLYAVPKCIEIVQNSSGSLLNLFFYSKGVKYSFATSFNV